MRFPHNLIFFPGIPFQKKYIYIYIYLFAFITSNLDWHNISKYRQCYCLTVPCIAKLRQMKRVTYYSMYASQQLGKRKQKKLQSCHCTHLTKAPWRHTREVKAQLHAFLTLVLDGGEQSASRPDRFAPGERVFRKHCPWSELNAENRKPIRW